MNIGLYDSGDIAWRPVSAALARARSLLALLTFGPVLLILVALAVTAARWVWIPAGIVLVLLGWVLWLVHRQVSAISYAELPEELVIRKGRVWRSLVSIPYGRLQYADMGSGPLARQFGLASVTIHTAAPSSGGTLPGLPLAEAESLRDRLTSMGEAQRAGL